MAQRRFNWLDVILTLISLLTLLFDIGTNILLTVQFFLNGDKIWGSLMLTFTIVSLVAMNAFSLKWHFTDGSLTCHSILLHGFLLAPVQRYLRVLWLGLKSCLTGHPRYTDAALHEQNDVSILRLFETFLESAPQLVLQVYIINVHFKHLDWIQGLSAGSSLISLSWALTVYCDTSRRNHQTIYQRRLLGLCLYNLWQFFMVSARVAALALFTSVFHIWVCLFAGIHWLIMTVWIWVKGTDFGTSKLERCLFNTVSGFIYIFVYLNVHDGPARSRMALYYCLVFLENSALFAVWIIYGKPSLNMKIASAVLIFGGFMLGGLFLSVYYRWLHPSGPHYLFTIKSTLPPSQHRGPQSPAEERLRPQVSDTLGTSQSFLKGSTLELSAEPVQESGNSGNITLSHLLNSTTKGVLESAWQNGMHSSDSSSSSSLDADDCSLNEFNMTVKSRASSSKETPQSLNNVSRSQQSFATVQLCHSDGAVQLQPAPSSVGQVPVASNKQTGDSSQPPTETTCKDVSMTEPLSESEEQELLEYTLREEADGTEAVPDPHSQNTQSRSRSGDARSSSSFDPESSSQVLQHDSSTLLLRPREPYSAATFQDDLQNDSTPSDSRMLSPLNVSHLSSKSDYRIASPSTTANSPDGEKDSDQFSQSFDAGESLATSPRFGESLATSSRSPKQLSAKSKEKSVKENAHEDMAPYPDLVESMSPQPQHRRLYVGNDDGFGEHAGGESLWGGSPNTSTNSSVPSQALPPLSDSITQPERSTDSLDSESEPACLNTMNLQGLHNLGKVLQPTGGKSHFEESEQNSLHGSPQINCDTPEMSWSSMNVNEDELSGLRNLRNLTPDDSMCSFASTDRDETLKHSSGESCGAERALPSLGPENTAKSMTSTPSFPRSCSTSSIYYDFSSAGVSPSPPPGLRTAQLSRRSLIESPTITQSCKQSPDLCWTLDYLNLDPAPPVEQEAFFDRHDPREVVIELLMDQLKRTRVKSSQVRPDSAHMSPLRMTHLQESPQSLGHSVDLFDQQAWRQKHDVDLSPVPLGHSDPRRLKRGKYKSDIDLMREALDLIEMQRSPNSWQQGMPESGSPEMYVSGQYRPPIVTQGREHAPRKELPSAVNSVEKHISRSRLEESERQTSAKFLPQQQHQTRDFMPKHTHLPQVCPTSQHISMPTSEREGLYRYFVDAVSPDHAPLWKTSRNTSAANPSRHHLLRRYLAENHTEAELKDDYFQRAASHSLPKAKSRALDGRPLSMTLPHRENHSYKRLATKELPDDQNVTTFNSKSKQKCNASPGVTFCRQPLQSLDNSPSISPSSVTQHPIEAKPASQPLKSSAPVSIDGKRHLSPLDTGQSSLAATPPFQVVTKYGTVQSKRHSLKQKQTDGRRASRQTASEISKSQGASSSKIKSVNFLR